MCTQTREVKTRRLLTTSFGLLLAGTTPARHRQKDRESMNDLRCSSTSGPNLLRTDGPVVCAAEPSATGLLFLALVLPSL